MYVTLKLDDNGCRIHSVSDNGNETQGHPGALRGHGWIVMDESYVVMPWKMVTRHGTNLTLA